MPNQNATYIRKCCNTPITEMHDLSCLEHPPRRQMPPSVVQDDVPDFVRTGRVINLPDHVTITPVSPTGLYWFSGTPHIPGWYFNRPKIKKSQVTVLLLLYIQNQLCALDPGGKHYKLVQTMPDEWAGPIPEPES